MSFVQVLSVGFALALCAVPVLVLLRPDRRDLADAGTEHWVPPTIVQNAWIAYALRVSVFLPLFALGAAGDVWPAIAGAVGFGAGTFVLGALRGPVTAFLDEARRQGRPATLHAFVAQSCGGATSVRLAAAVFTLIALLGLAGAEAAALVAVVTPLVGEGVGTLCLLALVIAAALYAVSAGENRVRYVSQALLGAIQIGVFGSAAFLLYLHASDLRPMPGHGAFALIALAVSSVALLIYRRTKYFETPALVAPDETSRSRRVAAKQVRRLLRIANIVISVFAVLVVVMAGMEFYVFGLADTVRNGLAVLGMAPRVPAVGLAGIALLAFTYPLVDAVSWQSAGAFVGFARAAGADPETRPAFFQRPVRIVAGETATIGLVLAAYGAIAALATDLPPDGLEVPSFVRQLMLFDNGISDTCLTLLLVGGVAMATATMGMAVSAAVTVVSLDILPALRPGTGSGDGVGSANRSAGLATFAMAVVIAGIWIVSGVSSAGIVDARFFAVALAFASLQVSLLPLLLARLCGVALGEAGSALMVLGGGATASLGATAAYLATANLLWLWLAIPACLLAGLSLLAIAAVRGRAVTRSV